MSKISDTNLESTLLLPKQAVPLVLICATHLCGFQLLRTIWHIQWQVLQLSLMFDVWGIVASFSAWFTMKGLLLLFAGFLDVLATTQQLLLCLHAHKQCVQNDLSCMFAYLQFQVDCPRIVTMQNEDKCLEKQTKLMGNKNGKPSSVASAVVLQNHTVAGYKVMLNNCAACPE